MSTEESLTWLTCIVAGFLLGGIMFSQLIPKILLQVDICEIGYGLRQSHKCLLEEEF